MTLQEVQANIRYNENLIKQHMNTLSELRGESESFNDELIQCNSQISDIKVQIKSIKTLIDELEQLKIKFVKLQARLADRQTQRIRMFDLCFSQNKDNTFIEPYVNGMKELLSGNEYKNIYYGLENAVQKISKKSYSLQKEINTLNKEINAKDYHIDTLKRKINEIKGKIDKANSDLTVRKQKVTYYRDQLKYAT